MLAGGVIAAWLVGQLAGNFRPGIVAILLATAVVLYDVVLKQTVIAPIVMGSCRFLNILLGMALAETTDTLLPRPWSATEWTIATGIGIYIVGVTIFARGEVRPNKRGIFLGGMAVMSLGLLVLELSGRVKLRPAQFATELETWPLMWLALSLVILVRRGFAVWTMSPNEIQIAVRNSLRAIIVIDAAIVLGFVGPMWACAVLALLMPMLVLERWFSTT